MNKWVKRGAVALLLILIAAGAIVIAGKFMASSKMSRQIDLNVLAVAPQTDAAHIERGRYLFRTRGCAECHGADGAGHEVINSGGMLVVAPNLTAGANGIGAAYRPEDWVRTIRHGVKPGRQPVMIMPSEDYNRLTDDDLGAVIAYIGQLPPVAGQGSRIVLPLPVQVLYGLGAIEDAAAKIDHSLAPSVPVAIAVSVEHGAYVANACIGCHGSKLSGGKIPGGPPDWPPAANLTPGKDSAMPRYPTPQLFGAMLRSGHRPDGSAISPVMPFGAFRELNDTDVFALHAFLKTVAARDAGQR